MAELGKYLLLEKLHCFSASDANAIHIREEKLAENVFRKRDTEISIEKSGQIFEPYYIRLSDDRCWVNETQGDWYENWFSVDTQIKHVQLQNFCGFLLHLRLPVKGGYNGKMQVFLNVNTEVAGGTGIKIIHCGNGHLQYLSSVGEGWQNLPAVGGIFYLPLGFDGYIKIPFREMRCGNWEPVNFSERYGTCFNVNVSHFGGEYGDLLLKGIYGIAEDSQSICGKFTEDKRVFNLITGTIASKEDLHRVSRPEEEKQYIDPVILAVSKALLFDSDASYEANKSKIKEFGRNITSIKQEGVVHFEALTAEFDKYLLTNPDRGFRIEVEYDVKKNSMMYTDDGSGPYFSVGKYMEYYQSDCPKLSRAYIHLNGYNGDIDEEGLNRIDAFLDSHRRAGIRAYVTFVHQYNVDGTGELGQDVMTRHIERLKPVLERNKDVIFAVCAGFLGAWGEWHSARKQYNRKLLLQNIVDALPKDMFALVRLPAYKNYLDPDDPRRMRIGYHLDALFGEEAASLGTNGVDPGKQPWEQIAHESPYVPVDGELYWGWWTIANCKLLDGFKIIKQMHEHRFLSLNIHHSYKEHNAKEKYSMMYWKETEITPAWLSENKIPYMAEWFKTETGQDVKRSVFDFIRDYTGYRIQLNRLTVRRNGCELALSLELKNYGFSAPFYLKSGFAVRNEAGEVVTATSAGNPREWHSFSANAEEGCNITLNSVLYLPMEKGRYTLCFYMDNPMGDSVKVANKIGFKDGMNELCVVELD